jgi:hypothetical protein
MHKGEWVEMKDSLLGFCVRKWEDDGIDGYSDKVIYAYDAYRLLEIMIVYRNCDGVFAPKANIDYDSLYDKLKPLLEAESKERARKLKESGFTKIDIPSNRLKYPEL